MKIRTVQIEDKDQILSLLSELTDVGTLTSYQWNQVFTEITENPYQKCLVAVVNQKIVGTVMGTVHRKFIRNGGYAGTVEELVVTQSHRGRGIGTKLLCDINAFFETHNCYKVTLMCEVEMASFYKRAKFFKTPNEVVLRKKSS